MNTPHDDQLERDLRELTRWPGESPGVWRRALESLPTAEVVEPARALWAPWRRASPAIAATVLVGLALLAAMLPPRGGVRGGSNLFQSPAGAHSQSAARGLASRQALAARADAAGDSSMLDRDGDAVGAGSVSGPMPAMSHADANETAKSAERTEGAGPARAAAPVKRLALRAEFHVEAPDVGAAARRLSGMVDAAMGEFIESSKVSGTGDAQRAEVIIRVAVSRFDPVRNEVRALGTVTEESSNDEDVTDQWADVSARLGSDRAAEADFARRERALADDGRPSEPEIRRGLLETRERIERLEASRLALEQRVSFATVSVTVTRPVR